MIYRLFFWLVFVLWFFLFFAIFLKTQRTGYLKMTRNSRMKVFCKKVLLKISKNSQKNTCVRVSFLIKLLVFSWKHTSGCCFWMTVITNSFQANVPFRYLLEALENLWYSDVFRGYRNGIFDAKKINLQKSLWWNLLLQKFPKFLEP